MSPRFFRHTPPKIKMGTRFPRFVTNCPGGPPYGAGGSRRGPIGGAIGGCRGVHRGKRPQTVPIWGSRGEKLANIWAKNHNFANFPKFFIFREISGRPPKREPFQAPSTKIFRKKSEKSRRGAGVYRRVFRGGKRAANNLIY